MTSEAFVWRWHPGAAEPVLCGRLFVDAGVMHFVFGRSYRARADAIALSPSLPVDDTVHRLRLANQIPRALADAGPDLWGRRVLEYQGTHIESELDYLLSGGGDRIGAFEFTPSTDPPAPPAPSATYEQLQSAAVSVEREQPLSPELEQALQHGTSIGGARPKATAVDGHRRLIVKLSSTTDTWPIVRLEAAGLALARQCRIPTPPAEVLTLDGKDVLLVERFDRLHNGEHQGRRQLLSALSLLDLQEDEHQASAYPTLAEVLRRWGSLEDAQQLYRRMVFNILVGNTDDHAKNHSAFWDGYRLALTPAYDIVPLPRFSQQSNQAMTVGEQGRASCLSNARSQAAAFGLTPEQAQQVEEEVVDGIRTRWRQVFAEQGVTERVIQRCENTTVLSPIALQ